MSRDPVPFELCGDLPTGTTVLEASAGTGKTYTIAALAARLRRRGRGRAQRAAARHLRPDGDQRASRPSAGTPGGGRERLADAVAQRRRDQAAQTRWNRCSRRPSRPS